MNSTVRFFEAPVVPSEHVDLSAMPLYRIENFPVNAGPIPWLDRPDALEQINLRLHDGEITLYEADLCRKWVRDGYVILKGFYSDALLDKTWGEYEAGIADGRVTPPIEPLYDGDPLPGRLANAHFSLEAIDKMLFEPRMSHLMSVLLGAKARPFQTIIGHKSSQQRAHSDYIHMSTYPNGFLAASWIAYEDIHPDAGPLVYYPGSHRLPYVTSDRLGIPSGLDYVSYHLKYEPVVQDLIKRHRFKEKYFLPKKGDVLLWHANLLHGGSEVKNKLLTRKALVSHFFAEGCICYHDLAGTLTHTQLGLNPYDFQHNEQLSAEIDALVEVDRRADAERQAREAASISARIARLFSGLSFKVGKAMQ